jgi:hypothetical protein
MKTHVAATLVLVLFTTACATTAMRRQFDDVPIPTGLTYQPDRSVVIESQAVKAGQLVYRGRLEPDSLGEVMRALLEPNGWSVVSRTTSPKDGIRLTYEKDGRALEVHITEELWYTYLTVSSSQAIQAEAAAATAESTATTAEPIESAPQPARMDASADASTAPETGSAPKSSRGDESFTDKVKHFFTNLFTW